MPPKNLAPRQDSYAALLEETKTEVSPRLFKEGGGVDWRYFHELLLDGPSDEYSFKYKVAFGMLIDRKVFTLENHGFVISEDGWPANPRAPILWGLPTHFVDRKDAEDFAAEERRGSDRRVGVWKEERRQ